MQESAILHIPKSNMAFPLDEETIQITLKTAKNDFISCMLIIGDPFEYLRTYEGNDVSYLWAPRLKPFQKMTKVYQTMLEDYYVIEAKTSNYRSKYAFLLYSETDVYIYNSLGLKHLSSVDSFVIDNSVPKGAKWETHNSMFNLSEYFNFPYINKEDLYQAPNWTAKTIWYQIFPDRFYPGEKPRKGFIEFGSIVEGINNHQFFGGSLQGIKEKIPYLKDLGITGIYFTPIFESPSAHKYDTTNYLLIDPQFGTNEDFLDLVNCLHKNNIKIILDAVFNHCGWDHPFFQDVLENGKKSKYYDCFFFDGTEGTNFPLKDGKPDLKEWFKQGNYIPNYRTFAFTPFMPKLNTTSPVMEEYLLTVTKYWMENYHIDGWRLDVSNEVSHKFWRKFHDVVKGINPDAYILGENWDDSNAWLMGDQLDAVMNYNLSLPIWRFFGQNTNDEAITAEVFKDYIIKLLMKYPKNITAHMFNLIDSHDTMRIIHRCGENKSLAKMAYLFMMAFPGSPTIYYGDEIGLSGGNDPDNRRCMIWDEDKQDLDMFAFMKELIVFRKNYPEFSSNEFIWHLAKDQVLIYQKSNLYFFYNVSKDPVVVDLPQELQDQIVYCVDCNNDKYLKDKLIIGGYNYTILEKNSERE